MEFSDYITIHDGVDFYSYSLFRPSLSTQHTIQSLRTVVKGVFLNLPWIVLLVKMIKKAYVSIVDCGQALSSERTSLIAMDSSSTFHIG